MGVEGGMKCVKFLLFFFNFIFWVSGSSSLVHMLTVKLSNNKVLLWRGEGGFWWPNWKQWVSKQELRPGYVIQCALCYQDRSADVFSRNIFTVGLVLWHFPFCQRLDSERELWSCYRTLITYSSSVCNHLLSQLMSRHNLWHHPPLALFFYSSWYTGSYVCLISDLSKHGWTLTWCHCKYPGLTRAFPGCNLFDFSSLRVWELYSQR